MKAKHIAHSDDPCFENEVKDLLLFRKIVEVEALSEQIGVLTLDNGIQLIVEGNEGCGGCSNGWYYLEELNNCDNAITDVECVLEVDGWGDVYHIFVYADDKKINCIEYRGEDNGYYGTGYDLFVRMKGTEGR